MISLMAPLSLIDALATATEQTLTELNPWVGMTHAQAQTSCIIATVRISFFVTFADAPWASRRDLVSQCGHWCSATEPHYQVDPQHRALRSGDTAKLAHGSVKRSGTAETQAASPWYEVHFGIVNLKEPTDREVPRTPGTLPTHSKGIYDEVMRSESAGTLDDKRSGVWDVPNAVAVIAL